MKPSWQSGRCQSGAVLLVILLLVAITAVASASLIHLGASVGRRQAERALLDIGQEFADALASYRRLSPAGSPDQPLSLDDLLRDKRFPSTVRHLRKIYLDPVNPSQAWGLVKDEDSGRISGVYSQSLQVPIRSANFPGGLSSLAGKSRYDEWVFTADQALAASGSGRGQQKRALTPQDLIEFDPKRSPKPAGSGMTPQDLIEP